MDDHYIDRVLSGDVEAFRYFLTTYKDMAFNLSVSIVKDDHYAEEVVQDAFMKAFDGLASFNRTAKFKSWFYRIVVNESFQRLRKMKRQIHPITMDSKVEYLEPLDQPQNSNEYDRVRTALKVLPAKEGLVLNLFYLEEHSLKEVGDVTGWTLANTKVLLHRARKNLRSILSKKKTIKD